MDINLKKGETIQLLIETNVADMLFPVGFSFLSSVKVTPSFGKWSVQLTYIGSDMLISAYNITRTA